jgi:hypothetical protein
MVYLLGKLALLIALPLVVFVGGAWIMSQMTGRERVTQQLLQAAEPADRTPLNKRWMGYDAAAAARYWQALGNVLPAETRFLELDLVFPLLYGAAFATSLLLAWAMLGRPFNPAWLIGVVGVTVIADWTENLVQLAQIRRAPALQAGWIAVASAATVVKLVFFTAALLVLVVLALVMLCHAVKTAS